MSDRAAASVAFTAAGIAVASTLLQWSVGHLPALVIGLVAFAGTGLRRYGKVDAQAAGPFGVVTGVVVVLVGLFGLFIPAITTNSAAIVTGPAVMAVSGIFVAAFAYADWLEVRNDRLVTMVLTAIAASGIGVGGLLAIVVWASVITSMLQPTIGGDLTPSLGTVLSAVALGLGTTTVGGLYLMIGNRGVEFIDLQRPTRRDAAYVTGGIITIVSLNIGIGLAFQHIGLESARHSVIRTAESNPEILLVLIPLSLLIIGPGEELLYRNVVQKSLYSDFSRPAAIVIASAIFAGVHLFAFSPANGTPLGTLNTLVVVFILALVLGTVYERTENIIVPAIIHGTFNAIAFAVTYAQLTGGLT